MSFVRDALVGSAVGIAVCEISRRRFTWPVIGLVGLAALALGALAVGPSEDLEVLRWDDAASSRFEVWSDLLPELSANPLGRGLGTVGAAAERALEDQGATTRDYDPEGEYVLYYNPVDSEYVLLLITGGVVTFGMFLGALIFLAAWARRHGPWLDSAWTEGLVVSALGILASLLVTGITRNILEEYPTGVIFWLVVGIIIATTRTALDAHAAAAKHARPSDARAPAPADPVAVFVAVEAERAAPARGYVAAGREMVGWRG
jgi:hypothetical protein